MRGPTALVRHADGQTTVGEVVLPADPHTDGPGWRGLHRVNAGSVDGRDFDVLIDDVDPFRFPETERLVGHQPASAWAKALAGGWGGTTKPSPAGCRRDSRSRGRHHSDIGDIPKIG